MTRDSHKRVAASLVPEVVIYQRMSDLASQWNRYVVAGEQFDPEKPKTEKVLSQWARMAKKPQLRIRYEK